MIVNAGNLQTLFVAFSTAFRGGLAQAAPQWGRIATPVPSSTKENEYGWLGKVPNVKEWIGDRVVNNIAQHGYTIKNKPWEMTIAVDRDDIADDTYGVYTPLFQEMGLATGGHYDSLVYGFLKDGFATPCYDKQYFFDTDHPVLDAAGKEVSVANTDGGAGAPWFLIDDKRALKPVILQKRKDFQLVRKDDPNDDNVFDRREFKYGVDARHNVGFGFWQFAWGSKQALTAANYELARKSLMEMKGDYGRPLGIRPRLLVVPPSLESAGLKLLNSENNDAGATNQWKGTAELLVVPWLA